MGYELVGYELVGYELAKKLEDAGFPQNIREKIEPLTVDVSNVGEIFDEALGILRGDMLVPTLEELIEACGNDLDQLENTMDGWRAYGSKGDEPIEIYWGKTPSEAVANLWLSLHTK